MFGFIIINALSQSIYDIHSFFFDIRVFVGLLVLHALLFEHHQEFVVDKRVFAWSVLNDLLLGAVDLEEDFGLLALYQLLQLTWAYASHWRLEVLLVLDGALADTVGTFGFIVVGALVAGVVLTIGLVQDHDWLLDDGVSEVVSWNLDWVDTPSVTLLHWRSFW